jgi:chromosome segregation protein
VADARLLELGEQVPDLDEDRRAASRPQVNAEIGKQADLSARLDALRTLQEKVQTEGKLKPWLSRHGLDGLQGLWTKVHIEAGWEIALESALREQLSNALEVGRIDTVRAFVDDPPPAKLAFYTRRRPPSPTRTRRCRG